MNEETARRILGGMVKAGDRLHDPMDWVSWKPGDGQVELDGKFTADELEAMAWWMRNAKTSA